MTEGDIQTLKEYSSMLCDDGLINHFGCHTTPQKDALFPLKVSDKEILLLPAPEFSPFLYRGENSNNRPTCKPTLFRNLNAEKKLILILKKYEFLYAIKTHPLTKEFRDRYFLTSYPKFPNYKLKLDYEAIAQHYGFITSHLDLTRDKNVAMFFMTSKYISEEKRYIPISDNSKKGILYTYDFKFGVGKHSINPIGFQPFSRPDKQKAFSMIFNKNVDFNSFDFVQKEEHILSKDFCEKYYEMFEGGSRLFPIDEVSEVSEVIKDSDYISKDSIELYSMTSKMSQKSIIKILKQNKISITDNKYSFNILSLELYNKNLFSILQNLDNRIKPRGIYPHIAN
ncbi:FRG domain-containing protein [Halarcobacter sp.]|uniref:FRG domain-containing protein n=1 Tax=Halarcobacter sp. TaxID=2321133 RepID=UPI002AAB478E|nr:FRG domain-containing protein [Halarcobacter sp.]